MRVFIMKHMTIIGNSCNETTNASCLCTIFSSMPETVNGITGFIVLIIFILASIGLISIFIKLVKDRYHITPKREHIFHAP